jgi:integrase
LKPAARITLRQAFERHYDKTDLCKGRIGTYRRYLKLWERFTGDPVIGAVDNEIVATFRAAAIEAGYSGHTVNGCWRCFRAIFRRVGPPVTGNPFGLGIIDRIPAMKAVKVQWKPPRRLSLETLARFYVACRHAQYPMRIGVPAPEWWRALIVVAYTTGLRRGDLFALTFDQIDFEAGELHVTAHKTGKYDVFPLHPAAVEHLQRIRTDRKLVFAGVYRVGSRMSDLMRAIQDAGNVPHFSLKHIRATAGDEIDRVARGLMPVFLQHAPRTVTGMSYANATDELREAIGKMRIPLPFRHGPKMTDRAREEERREVEKALMRPERFAIATKPDAREFQFVGTSSFWFRGRCYPMGGSRGRVLKALALAPGPVPFDVLALAITGNPPTPENYCQMQHKVSQVVSDVRKRLRRLMILPAGWEPVPCVDLRGRGGAWTLCLPPELGRTREAS